MKEIGGYIELDSYHLPMPHERAIALNCGRNALAYMIRAKGIKKIALPFFLCDSVSQTCIKEKVEIRFYHIGSDFKPCILTLSENEWLYVVNYYGQVGNEEIKELRQKYGRIIVDQAQGFFQLPVEGIDTLYTCRKWFGVADGAFLYTDTLLEEDLDEDCSFDRMRFLLGRYERTASEFYNEYNANNKYFAEEPIKKMSKLTRNLLHGIDYAEVERIRKDNYSYLQDKLGKINNLKVHIATFMYPLLVENGKEIRKELQQKKIYIPILWPSVLENVADSGIEQFMAENILPLPVDQRYGIEDMEYVVREIKKCIS